MPKVISLIFSILMFVFGSLQFNDPDPYIWVTVYFVAAVLHFSAYKNSGKTWMFFALGFLALLWGISIFPDRFEGFADKMESKPWIEEARESVGLLIMASFLLIDGIRLALSSKK